MTLNLRALVPCALVLLLSAHAKVQAQWPATSVISVTPVVEPPPVFKATSLEGRVAEAMEQARKGDPSFIYYLMNTHEKEPDKVLRLLKPYVNDPNLDARLAIIETASGAKSLEALNLLTALAGKFDLGNYTMGVLYADYTPQQLLKWGDERLRGVVLRGVIRDRSATSGTMLLSIYKNDANIISFLERRRASYKTIKPGTKVINPGGRGKAGASVTDELACLDLALSELGKEDAVQRINQRFATKEIEELLGVLRYLKFVNNKSILLQSVELVKDKRRIDSRIAPAGADYIIPKDRVCDEAVSYLADKAGVSLGIKILPGKIYSDQELTQAYQRIKDSFTAK